jgi:hypothetical protein
MMNDKEILKNAPEGFLSVDIDDGEVSGYTDLNIRSLADIAHIVELEEALQNLLTATAEIYLNSKEIGWAEDAANKALKEKDKDQS